MVEKMLKTQDRGGLCYSIAFLSAIAPNSLDLYHLLRLLSKSSPHLLRPRITFYGVAWLVQCNTLQYYVYLDWCVPYYSNIG